ncbi:serine/threonine protein kinase [Clostridium aceticum]|uniref:Serine/threonine protein kinase n=1 Tax=Clostridium aceticum TaxID=84022 RepID=A0A0G3WGV8_9CLOT|nr:protein kinase [Clostridium aceticum]AKL97110.1 serine/threonine protein kinase [Clostridium aceticum]
MGEGGVAAVYLVENIEDKKNYALKISKDNFSINREYALLKKFHKVDMIVNAHDIDDWQIEGEVYYYIILEYIEGKNLKEYCEKNKLDKNIIISIILIILRGIHSFHSEEYIVGDLKLENIMLDKNKKQLKFIDLGGVVKIGENIKEFTPVYDRASWRCGDRKAEDSYDIFTVMMLFANLLLKENIHPAKQNIDDVIKSFKKLSLGKTLEGYIEEGFLYSKKPLSYFIEKLEKIYVAERENQRKKMLLLKDRKINFLLGFSMFFFMITIIFIFLT